jgi:hypothetical protein
MIITLLLLFTRLCESYLDKTQISYIRAILTHPHTPEKIVNKTQVILFNEYRPWLNKQVRTFREKYRVANIYTDDLNHYAALGLLEAIHNYYGNTSLANYAEKHVDGKLRNAVIDLTPLKPLNYYQIYVKQYKALKPGLVSYKNYWVFERQQCKNLEKTNPIHYASIIRSIILEMPSTHSSLFFQRYDSVDLHQKDRVANICNKLGICHKTYRKRMISLYNYVRSRIAEETIIQSSSFS